MEKIDFVLFVFALKILVIIHKRALVISKMGGPLTVAVKFDCSLIIPRNCSFSITVVVEKHIAII